MNWQLKYDRSRKKQCSLPKQTSEKQNPIRCQHSFRFSSMSYQNGYQLTKCTAADTTKHDESRVHNMQNDEMVTISFKWITREQPCENKMCQKWHDIHTHTCAFERARIHSLYTCVCVRLMWKYSLCEAGNLVTSDTVRNDNKRICDYSTIDEHLHLCTEHLYGMCMVYVINARVWMPISMHCIHIIYVIRVFERN